MTAARVVLAAVLLLTLAASAAASDSEPSVTRARPGGQRPAQAPPDAPPPEPLLPARFVPVPDRWRLVEALGVHERWYDPYHQSTLKGDRPIFGEGWFLNVGFISDTLVEPRRLPTPVGLQGTRRSGSLDAFGDGAQLLVNQNWIGTLSLSQGDTVFRPPDWEFRVTGVMNLNYLEVETLGIVDVDPADGTSRVTDHFAIQELFVDRHLLNLSDRYDFVSLRAGVQGFSSDFRGFLFQDEQLGVRLFGNQLNNRLQYNLAWFRRIEKNTNSGLNSLFKMRDDDVFLGNVYYQDFPVRGFTVQGTVAWNRNREGDDVHFDNNGFLQRPASMGTERPHDYDAIYLGLNGDGHLGRLNLTASAYYLLGSDRDSQLAGREVEIRAFFLAGEASMDFDWLRVKLFGLFASGDDDPFDGTARGFDAIFENPRFAGGATSFWIRQPIPFIGGGGVVLSGRNAVLPSLRSSKEEGQSNFVNPGLFLVGAGADFDILPELRLVLNVSWLEFADTSVLSVLRNQGRIANEIGLDLSGALVIRPLFINNVGLNLSGAVLLPARGLEELYGDDDEPFYSVLVNLVLAF